MTNNFKHLDKYSFHYLREAINHGKQTNFAEYHTNWAGKRDGCLVWVEELNNYAIERWSEEDMND